MKYQELEHAMLQVMSGNSLNSIDLELLQKDLAVIELELSEHRKMLRIAKEAINMHLKKQKEAGKDLNKETAALRVWDQISRIERLICG